MSRIFLSHSSANNAEAIAVRDWLIAHGWDDIFLDLDPERGLKAGQRWQEALKHAAELCEAVVFLVSPAWRASEWCVAEFLLAKQMNKRIVGVIVDPIPLQELPVEMTSEWQIVDLTAGARDYETTVALPPSSDTTTVTFSQDGLDRLRIGLSDAGLDPRFFEWPPKHHPNRAPYRGLRPFEAEDAGIFFGRDGPIVVGMDMLRGLREAAPPRLAVILGASGAGKSSFMRAGLLPRLAREDQHFLPLPVIRPEQAVINGDTGLIASLEQACEACGLSRTRADLRTAVSAGTVGLTPILSDLVEARTPRILGADGTEPRNPPTLILSIDQAEELFIAEGADEAQAFLTLLHDLATKDAPATLVLFTIRSDSYEVLQNAKELEGLRQHTLSLPAMPQGSYADVIRGPARRLEGTNRALAIEEPLVDALLADIEEGGGKDALPLLAFTLERLYHEHGGDGDLKLSEYEQLGRVAGSIEAAVERALKAADGNPAIPRDRSARLALLRRGLIPWLAGLDPDTGTPRRRVAKLSEIPADARPLIDLLVNEHLLTTDTDQETQETIIEPAHEALLRQWDLLAGWLKEDEGQLIVIDGVRRAAKTWMDNGQRKAWLTHASSNLVAAERLRRRPDLAQVLEESDWAYIKACRRKVRRGKTWTGLLVASVVAFAGLGYGGFLNRTYLEGRINLVRNLIKDRDLKPGMVTRDCADVCPEMVVLPAGTFRMGSPKGEGGDEERPRHKVTIAQPFMVSKFEVTFAEWDSCYEEGGCNFKPTDNGWGRGRRPVIDISWNDIVQYLTWLSTKTGMAYRLLSEAEWEYAARGITDANKPHSVYSWGDDLGQGNANCRSCGSKWDGKKTAPVGSFKPNAFGLYDMHGNVYEWVQDCWSNNYKGATADGMARKSGSCGVYRVLRGGSWISYIKKLRAAGRGRNLPGYRSAEYGFRVARDPFPARIP